MQIKNDFYAQMMARCLQIAQNGAYQVAPNPMVGAVLTDKDGNILAEGWHQYFGGPHAEVNCFRNLESKTTNDQRPTTYDYKDCTLFVSLEPCSHYGKTPPCADLIVEKGIGHVVVGMLDPNPLVAGKGIAKLRAAGIKVEVGVLEKECRELNKRFLCLQEKKRPYVILKWAQTEDGYLDKKRSMKSDEIAQGPIRISSPFTKRLVHQMRAENMAILVGANTAILDDPKLLTTHWAGRNPIRVLLDRHGRVPKTARIFSDDAETIVYSERTDWPFVVEDLGKRGIHSILVEGGAQILNHIIESGIYDEIHVEVSPFVLGEAGVPAPHIDLLVQPSLEVDSHRLYTITHNP